MKVTVNQQPYKKVISIGGPQQNVVSVGIQGPAGPNFVTLAEDVDATTLINGSVLVYNTSTSKWKATTTLENQNLEGGHY